MKTNVTAFRAKMDRNELCFGAGITFTDPTVTESLARFVDFFWIDLEHNPTSLESMVAHLIAARAGQTAGLVRIPSGDVGWIKRVLDSGAEGIILPQANSCDEIADFVAACRYPPLGRRGFGPRRPTLYGQFGGEEYIRFANENLFVVAQIETATALAEIESIVKLPGLDSIVVGPSDLSGSLGLLGQLEHPQVLDAIKRCAELAREAGLYVGLGMGADREYALKVRDLGVQWIQAGNDFEYMNRFAEQFGRALS